MKFSIIIPILNEEKNIKKLSVELIKNLKKITYEVIFVDDNSTDNSFAEFKKIKNKNFKFISRYEKRDLSKSCILGIDKSKYENIVIMDGDLQHRPSCLKKMITIYKKNPHILVGARQFKKIKGLTITRKFISRFIIFFINFILGKKTTDPMSGFFIINKKIFFKIKNKLFNKGFKILADIIYSADKNIQIANYPIKFNNRLHHKSKMNLSVLWNLIVLIIFKFFKK